MLHARTERLEAFDANGVRIGYAVRDFRDGSWQAWVHNVGRHFQTEAEAEKWLLELGAKAIQSKTAYQEWGYD